MQAAKGGAAAQVCAGGNEPAPFSRAQPSKEGVHDFPRNTNAHTLGSWALETGGCAALLLDAGSPGLTVLQIGPGFERLSGYSAHDYLGRDYDFLEGPATDARGLDQIRRAITAGSSARVVLRSYRKDGSSFWNEVTLSAVPGAGGEPTAVRVLHCDATERIEARAQLELVSTLLADRQQFTSAVLEGIHAAIITADARGRVTFINRVACRTLGVSPSFCVDKDLIHLLELPPGAFDCLTECDRVKRLSYPFERPDGQRIDIGLSMSRAFGDAHHDLGYFVVFRDLSEKMKFEMDLRRVERLAALGTMVAGFAHEVRNPVATLRILLETLRAEAPEGDPADEYYSRMMIQIERIERLVQSALRFGRPVAPRLAIHPAQAIAAAALDAIAVRTRAFPTGALRVEIASDLPPVVADDAQITQVLVILLENALDAAGAPDGVTLRVRPGPHGRHVRFEVEDQGRGMSESLMSRIFDPFFTTKPHGTGLGLSIAQQLVHENQGRIEASSVEGKGTTFTVLVPRAGAPAARVHETV